jgi:iron complex outermembrane receptor protein
MIIRTPWLIERRPELPPSCGAAVRGHAGGRSTQRKTARVAPAHPGLSTLFLSSSTCATLLASTLVCTNATAADSQLSDSPALAEVVVTAQRRAERLDNVPISVSAYDQASLDNMGIRGFSDVARTVPGVTLTPYWGGAMNVSIRGISSLIGAGTTGVYLDDTPMQVRFVGAGSTSTNAYPAVFDLERVEVLRGPQGTLFGAGSEGGTIRFIMPEPGLKEFTGFARSEVGSTRGGDLSYEAGTAVGGPIIDDKLGFRVSAYVREDGGWLDRAPYPGSDVTARNVNSQTTTVLHGALTLAPTENLRITPSFYYQSVHRDDLSSYWPSISDPANGVFRSGQPLAQPGVDHFVLPSLKVQWDFGSATAISNTSYLDRNNPSVVDYSVFVPELLGVPRSVAFAVVPDFTSPVAFVNSQQTFTQEIRLQSNPSDSRLTWVVGAFYQRARQSASETIFSPRLGDLTMGLLGLPVEGVFGVPLGSGGLSYLGVDSTVDEQKAGFGQVDVKLAQPLTLTVGVRVAKTSFTFKNSQQGALNGGSTASSGSESDTPVTPKIGLSYKPSDAWMLFASAAKGFRPGGANTAISATVCAKDLQALGLSQAPSSYSADSVWSYEAGAKGQAFDGSLHVDGSVYYIPWKNTQLPVLLSNCGFTFIANAGSALSQGADLQLDWIVLRALKISAGVAYTDAHYTATALGGSLPGGGRSVIIADGDPLTVAPWQITSSAEYSAPFRSGKSLYLRLIANYSSSYHSAPSPNAVTYDPGKTRMDSARFASLRGGVRSGAWDVSVFVNNLFNSYSALYVTHDTVAPSSLYRIDTYRPRTIGITGSYRY